jgi:hypothetical protein
MAFLGGNTDSIKFSLTKEGQKTLMTKGLENQIFYYTLYDDGVNYELNAFPYLALDINGSKKTIISDSITFENNLIK